ncbi:MAG: aldose 1-epimerase family protein [Bacteroidota bacterium]
MTFTLENEQLFVKINRKGSELVSLQSKKNGLEYLWQADPAVWSRHAPVLFPIVGKLRNNQYKWQGQTYTLPQHGFARDQAFEVVEHTSESITLVLKSNAETQKVYPFHFELRITHALVGNRVDITYQAINQGESEMQFSIGAHPGFICPLLPNETFEDYYLEFDQPETLDRKVIENSLYNGQTEPFLQHAQTIPLHRSLFERDAIVVTGYLSNTLTLKSNKSAHSVKVSFDGFPYLGIWTKDIHSPFICLEPWYGLADYSHSSGQLKDKEGMIALKPQEEFTGLHSIEIS